MTQHRHEVLPHTQPWNDLTRRRADTYRCWRRGRSGSQSVSDHGCDASKSITPRARFDLWTGDCGVGTNKLMYPTDDMHCQHSDPAGHCCIAVLPVKMPKSKSSSAADASAVAARLARRLAAFASRGLCWPAAPYMTLFCCMAACTAICSAALTVPPCTSARAAGAPPSPSSSMAGVSASSGTLS
jgi:hypothetical protein